MKFLILNSFHRDDKGDAALVHILVDQLLAIDPKGDVVIASMEDPLEYSNFYRGRNIGSFELHSSSRMHPGLAHLFYKIYILCALWLNTNTAGKFSWLFTGDLKKIYNECATADLVVSVGGGYFLTKRGLANRAHLFFAVETLKLCKKLGRHVVTAPVSAITASVSCSHGRSHCELWFSPTHPTKAFRDRFLRQRLPLRLRRTEIEWRSRASRRLGLSRNERF